MNRILYGDASDLEPNNGAQPGPDLVANFTTTTPIDRERIHGKRGRNLATKLATTQPGSPERARLAEEYGAHLERDPQSIALTCNHDAQAQARRELDDLRGDEVTDA